MKSVLLLLGLCSSFYVELIFAQDNQSLPIVRNTALLPIDWSSTELKDKNSKASLIQPYHL